MRSVQELADWKSVPGLAVAGSLFILAFHSISAVSPFGLDGLNYLIGNYQSGGRFWTVFSLILVGLCAAYSVNVERGFSRYALSASGGILVAAELRHHVSLFAKITGVLLAVFLISVLSFETLDGTSSGERREMLQFPPDSLFELVVFVTSGLLTVTVGALVLSAVLFGASPLLGDLAGSRVGVIYLTGPRRAYTDVQTLFRAAIVAAMFTAVVPDVVRHRAVRWLTAITLVTCIAGTSFFWYYTFWTATVAAVGALLTVITLALVLDERTEATLNWR